MPADEQGSRDRAEGAGLGIPNEVAVEQLQAADVVVLNKMDLVSKETAAAVKRLWVLAALIDSVNKLCGWGLEQQC